MAGSLPGVLAIVDVIAAVAIAVGAGTLLFRGVTALKRRLLWRVRRKLIISYIFVGFVPVMLGLMVLGLIWVVTYYISGTNEYPVPALGRWNLGVGFGLMMSGFLMTTRWR